MNRFKVFCFDREGKNRRFVLTSDGNITNEVFDKLRIFISMFRDVLFVGTLQQTPNLAELSIISICFSMGKFVSTSAMIETWER